jgi:hypothetical protein
LERLKEKAMTTTYTLETLTDDLGGTLVGPRVLGSYTSLESAVAAQNYQAHGLRGRGRARRPRGAWVRRADGAVLGPDGSWIEGAEGDQP